MMGGSMKQNALDRIFDRLNSGRVYGVFLTNVRFPCFYPVLSCDGQFIYWRIYGSSANKNSLKALAWILENVFKKSPEEFERAYYLQ